MKSRSALSNDASRAIKSTGVARVAKTAAAFLLAVVAVGSLLSIAIAEHRQSDGIRQQACYSRANAVALIAQFELNRKKDTATDPALILLSCDRQFGQSG